MQVWRVFMLTVHKSLQALHQGFDRAGQVPRVLLDVLVDDVATANRPIFCLSELCSRNKAGMCERACVSVV